MNILPGKKHGFSFFETVLIPLLAVAVFSPVISRMTGTAYDYVVHRDIAASMLANHQLSTPHFLLQMAIIGIHSVLPGTLDNALEAALLLAYAATAFLVCRILLSCNISKPFALFFTLALMLAAPIAVLAPLDRHLYFGYIPPNVFHNPTIILLKPLALISFCYAIRAISEHAANLKTFVACSVVTVACAITKPSLTICILPALVLSTLIQLKNHRKPDWKLLIFGFFVPATITLGVQYWITYSSSQLQGVYQGSSRIVFAPFVVMNYWSSFLAIKYLLSLAFPLCVLALYPKKAITDASIQLAWILFLVGSCYTYLLAESGPRLLQGNFLWSGQISIFILFVYSMNFLIKINSSSGNATFFSNAKVKICISTLLLHLISGIIFYASEFIQTERYW